MEEEIEVFENNEVSDDTALVLPENINRKIFSEIIHFSIRELRLMEEEGSLIVRPEYQRKFVMDNKLSSRLIESILMDVPSPVIYLAEEKDNTFSVIDGQQRLTSFISFIKGKYPDNRDFSLSSLKILTELNKKKFTDLDKSLQQKIFTTKLPCTIIKKESQDDIKFDIFERLNTGSVRLNEDEIRNVIYRGEYIKLLAELENDELFHKLVLNDNYKKRMIYRGMILRFFAISEKSYINYKPSIKQFCNKELRDNRFISIDKQKEYKARFKKSLELVYTVFGEYAFRRFVFGNKESVFGKWNKNINMSLYDIQMCGFVNYEKHQIIPKADEIRESLIKLMSYDDKFITSIEISTSDRNALQTRFKIWLDNLEKIVGTNSIEPRIFPYNLKKQLFLLDRTCKICGQQILEFDDAEIDHILPYSEGGKTSLENAQITHRFCNRQKSNQTLAIDNAFDQQDMVEIFANYLGSEITAKFNPKNGFVLLNGKLYESPSAAGSNAKIELGAHDNISTNGWQFWRFIDKFDKQEKYIDELRKK